MASLFSADVRSMHEPVYAEYANPLAPRLGNRDDTTEARKRIVGLDRQFWLAVESAQWYAWFADILQDEFHILRDEFHDAKFILTVRDCFSWLDSIKNQHPNLRMAGPVNKIRDLCRETRRWIVHA